MILSFAGYTFCKGHSCSYIQVAQQTCLPPRQPPGRIHRGGAGQRRRLLPLVRLCRRGAADGRHDPAARRQRQRRSAAPGTDATLRVGLQFVKGLSASGGGRGWSRARGRRHSATSRISGARGRACARRPPAADQGRRLRRHRGRARPGRRCSGRWTRDSGIAAQPCRTCRPSDCPTGSPPPPRVLREYPPERQRQDAYAAARFLHR